MISEIKNPWVRKPLVVIALPVVFALDATLGVLIALHDALVTWCGIARRSWRGR